MNDSDSAFRQARLFAEDQSQISTKAEDQWFDRKSFRIKAVDLADAMIGLANAEGGTLLVGVEKDGTVTGINHDPAHLNDLLRSAIDYSVPTVSHESSSIPCKLPDGTDSEILAIEVPPSTLVHHNRRDEAFLRIGDRTRKLGFSDTQELHFSKGQSFFDGTVAIGATLADLDTELVEGYRSRISSSRDAYDVLKARGLLIGDGHTLRPASAAVLLFGTSPEEFFPGALIRVLRYDGKHIQFGTRANLVFDQRIGRAIPRQISEAILVVSDLIPKFRRLNPQTGLFEFESVLPQFAWREAIVNAVTHRSYNLQGDHIRVSLFDDRLEVFSPGRLAGSVRVDNIRRTRFSRNPRISRVLTELNVVQELNEGVNRMFEEMALAGLKEPLLEQTDSGFRVTLFLEADRVFSEDVIAQFPGLVQVFDDLGRTGRITIARATEISGLSAPTIRRQFQQLAQAGILERVARSANDPAAYWQPRKQS